MNEIPGRSLPGLPIAALLLVLAVLDGLAFLHFREAAPAVSIPTALWFALLLFLLKGLIQIPPNHGCVLQLFGRYVGTVRTTGLRWCNPLCTRWFLSLKERNFETSKLKVNDAEGNPIEIAAIVVWKVQDTALAMFGVDDFVSYVAIQSESAVRQLAQHYPYDSDDGTIALRSHGDTINTHLAETIQARIERAGVQAIEARISHLAYAPEIAQAMLQRQQASAIMAARARIVESAVGMIALALAELQRQGLAELDEAGKAALVNNLLVVLCSDRAVQPVLPTAG